MEESNAKKKMENPRLRFALESVVAMWRIKDKPTSTDCYESFRQISSRENVFCVTRRQYGNYLNILEEGGLIKTKIYSRGRKGIKKVISVPKEPNEILEGHDVLSGGLWETRLSKEMQKIQKFKKGLSEDFEIQEREPGAILMSIWEFKRYLKEYKNLKRGFNLDGVLNTFSWGEEVPYDEELQLASSLEPIRQKAKSTEFIGMLRVSDCIISSRPTHWFMETKKWLIQHEVLAESLYMRPPKYKPSKNDCIIFKSATIVEQGVEIYLDDEKDVANGIKHVLPSLISCYLDISSSTTQIVVRY